NRIQKHGSVADRQHEAIAIWPDGIARIEPEDFLPQSVDHRRQSHRRARMPRVGLLHGIHRQGADRIDAKAVERGGIGHGRASSVSQRVRSESVIERGAKGEQFRHEASWSPGLSRLKPGLQHCRPKPEATAYTATGRRFAARGSLLLVERPDAAKSDVTGG